MAGKSELTANTIKALGASSKRILYGAGIGGGLGALTADRGNRVGGAIKGGILGGVAGAYTPSMQAINQLGAGKAFKNQFRRRNASVQNMFRSGISARRKEAGMIPLDVVDSAGWKTSWRKPAVTPAAAVAPPAAAP
jgi:hypothetical protein